ncbi:hypothetical protein F4808DRAFT_425859 [Astrocystis sublimbata]|nr:hypothetical protein F4808DRAFT_425859 [Astrocystis sublimbata]
MSFIEQPMPLEGQTYESQQRAATVENSVDIAMDPSQPNSTPAPKEDPLQVLVDADDEQCLIEEARVMNTKELRTKEVMIEPPAIPQRNTLRASKLLNSLRINTMVSATKSLNTTQNMYLSSEEDASSSADDYSDSDYGYESSDTESEQSSIGRKSQEVTARAVSVVFVGKPSMVDLASCRRAMTPPKRPQSEFFGRSVSSPLGAQGTPDHAPRKVSVASTSDLPKTTHSFLSQDPFNESPYTRRETVLRVEATTSAMSYPRTPKTPTAAFQRLQKTFSLARKRSRPNLKAALESGPSMSSLHLSNPNTSKEYQASVDSSEAASPPRPQSPITYNEILKVARRNSIAAAALTSAAMQQQQTPTTYNRPPTPPTPVTARRGLLSGLNNRRRSMRIKT